MLLAPVVTQVAFWHGHDRLVADVVLPPWPGPHPCVVLVQDPADDAGADAWQRRLAAAGIASLTYDPAGTGRSGGDWRSQQVGDRASEVLAAREVLTAHPDVDPQAVALVAVGEAGWAAIRAEAFAGVFAGLVLLAVPVLGPVDLAQYRLGVRLERHGVTADEIGLALTLLRERLRRLAAGDDVRQVLLAEAACRLAPWYRLMPALDAGAGPHAARLVGVDPAAELAAVTCPVLTLNGAVDPDLPVQHNLRAARDALRSGGHRQHACILVPEADGRLRDPDGRVAAGVPELVVTWLDRRLARSMRPARAAASERAPERLPERSFEPVPERSFEPVRERSYEPVPERSFEPVPERSYERAPEPAVVPAPAAHHDVLVGGPAGYGDPADADTNGFFVAGRPLPPSVRTDPGPWLPEPAAALPGGSPHEGAGRVDTAGELRLPLTVVLPVIGRSYSS